MRGIFRVRDLPLAAKMIVAMVLLSVAALGALSAVTNTVTNRTLESHLSSELVALSAAEARGAGNVLEQHATLVRSTVATDDDVLEAVKASNAAYTGTEGEILDRLLEMDAEWQAAPEAGIPLIEQTLNNQAADKMRGFLMTVPEHVETFATDRYGGTVAASNRTSDYYQADEDWWQAAWSDGEGDIYFSPPVFDESANATIIEIAMPIVDEDSGEVIGVVKDAYSIQGMVDHIQTFELGETGVAHLIDADGNYVADPHGEEVGTPVEEGLLLEGRIFSGSGYDLSGIAHGGQPAVVGYAPVTTGGRAPEVDRLGWVVEVTQDRSEAFAAVRQQRIIALASTVVAALAASGLAFVLASVLTRQVGEIDKVFRAAAVGDFDARAEVFGRDELGRAAEGVNAMLGQLTNLLDTAETERTALQMAVDKLVGDVGGLAAGDLSMQAEVDEAATGAIAEALNYAVGELRGLVSDVENTATQVTDASSVMAEVVQLVVDQAASSAEVAERAAASAHEGDQAVSETVAAMGRIRDDTQETARRIKRLGEASQEISEVVRLIEDVADRTTVLALNASIQAAAAGEAGRGFAVVAEEVQRLAERVAGATRQIEDMVKGIQTEANEAMVSVEDTTREVVEGSQLAQQAGERMAELNSLVGELANLIQHVAETTSQQTTESVAALTHLSAGLQSSVAAFGSPGGDGHEGDDNGRAAS